MSKLIVILVFFTLCVKASPFTHTSYPLKNGYWLIYCRDKLEFLDLGSGCLCHDLVSSGAAPIYVLLILLNGNNLCKLISTQSFEFSDSSQLASTFVSFLNFSKISDSQAGQLKSSMFRSQATMVCKNIIEDPQRAFLG